MNIKQIFEGFGRSANIFRDFYKDIMNLPNVDKVINAHAISNGHALFLRGTDGNAYEIIIRPAEYAEFFQDERKAEQHRARKDKELSKRRMDGGLE